MRRTTRCGGGTALVILCATASACGLLGETKTWETVRGRLKFVQSGTATGSYANEKTYSISSGALYFSGKRFRFLDTIDGCDPSPNEAREAFVCTSSGDLRLEVSVVSAANDKPKSVVIHEGDSRDAVGLPEWVGDREGAWLIFGDFLYDVETGEKRTIKDAPGIYEAQFRAVSPDVETVVYQLDCPGAMAESDTGKRMEALCADADARKREVLWLVEARTGAVETRSLSRDAHEWLVQDQTRFPGGHEWLAFFRSQLAWERDGNGRFQLAAPRAETP